MTESVYKVIELIGTSKNPGKRPPPRRSKGPAKPSGISVSPKSSSSTCNWTPRARSKPTAPSSTSRSSSRTDGAVAAPTSSRRRGVTHRHARPCAGHPRPFEITAGKTWMAGTSPAMTMRSSSAPSSSSPAGSRPCRADGMLRRRERWRSACRDPIRPSIPPASSPRTDTCRGPCGRRSGSCRRERRSR